MDNALLLYIKKILGNLEEINLEFDSVKNTVNNIEVTVNDIYTGNSVTDWINDLVENGTSSDTYKDASRMSILCENKAACTNPSINTLLFNYAIDHSLNIGVFFNQLLGSVSGVDWSSLTTLSHIAKNSSAFKAVADNNSAFSMFYDRGKSLLWDNRGTTGAALSSSQNAIELLTKYATTQSSHKLRSGSNYSFDRNMFVLSVSGSDYDNNSRYYYQAVLKLGGSTVLNKSVYQSSSPSSVKKFADRFEANFGLGMVIGTVKYVDFS